MRRGIGAGARRVGAVWLFAAAAVPAIARAQVSEAGASIPVLSAVAAWNAQGATMANAAQANTISLLLPSGSTQTIAGLLDGQLNTFPTPVRVTTQWDITSLVSFIDLVGFFATPSAALSTGTTHIPSSLVEGRMTTGRATAFTPFTQAPVNGQGVAGGTLHLFRQLIIAPFNGSGSRTDQLDLRINLQGQPVLAPGNYRGTLTLRVTAY